MKSQQKPFWENMQNPITMHKISRNDIPSKAEYNKNRYKKLTAVS